MVILVAMLRTMSPGVGEICDNDFVLQNIAVRPLLSGPGISNTSQTSMTLLAGSGDYRLW